MKLPTYRPSHLLSAVQNPKDALLELNKLYQTKVNQNTGVELVDEDWDNLIILDACRYDMFEEFKFNNIDGELTSRVSKGSMTVQFLRENFGSDDFPEIVYASANPNISYIDARFHKRARLWDGYTDEELGVVPPEPVTTEALQLHEQYPNKRLIVHYMQPHFPFIGEFGQKLYERGEIQHYSSGNKFWQQLDGEVDADAFKRAYEENLRVVLPAVKRLIKGLPGRTVVTSDHGNEFGRFGVYGHPSGVYLSGLVTVPWLVVDGGERKEIVPGTPTDGPADESADIEEKLAALGYRT